MRLVHATGKTRYKILYQHTMYVINLSNISIKTNIKQITKVELKFVQYSRGDYILCMTSHYFYCTFTNVRLLYFVSHSNYMTSCQSSSAENVSYNIVPFFYHHSVVIQHLVSDTLYQRRLSLISKENVPELQIKKKSCQTLGPGSKRVLPDLSTFCQTYFFLEIL